MKHLPIFAAGALMLGLLPASAQSQDEMKRQQPEVQRSGEAMGGQAGGEAAGRGDVQLQRRNGAEGEEQRSRGAENQPAEEMNKSKASERAQARDNEEPVDQAGKSGEKSGRDSAGRAEEGKEERNRQANEDSSDSDEVTGSIDKNEKNVRVELQPEQRTIIKETIVKQKVRPVDVDFSISVGTVIPHSVTLYDLPPTFVEIVPAYRPYKYILVEEGTLLVIDPDTYEIIDVIYV